MVRRKIIKLLVSSAVYFLLLQNVQAEFQVLRADTRLEQGVYLLNAYFNLDVGKQPIEALNNGVPLYFQIQVEIIRERNWWADKTVAELAQRYRLEFHPLSEQYLLVNLNTGERRSFYYIEEALATMSLLLDYPLLDRVIILEGARYLGQIWVELELGKLPLPLFTSAYFSDDWNLVSEEYQWLLK